MNKRNGVIVAQTDHGSFVSLDPATLGPGATVRLHPVLQSEESAELTWSWGMRRHPIVRVEIIESPLKSLPPFLPESLPPERADSPP